MKLYELTDNFKQAERDLNEMLYSGEIDEQTVTDTLDGIRGEIEEKAKNVAMYIGNIESTAKAIKEQEKAMSERRKRLEAQAEGIRRYLKDKMQECEISKIECPFFTMSIKKNPPKLVIDESQLDRNYTEAVITYKPKKDVIKQELKAGNEIQGARLEQGTRLDIK